LLWQKHKITFAGIAVLAAVLVAMLAGIAAAQSQDDQSAAPSRQQVASRHVDYDVSLQINGDLSSVDPKLAGVLPLNLNASGGADIHKSDSGPSASGDLKLDGFNALVQKFAGGDTADSGRAALGANIVGGILSDVQFTAVDKHLYVQLGGVWYDAGDMTRHQGAHGHHDNGDTGHNDAACACAEGAFAGEPQALLKNQKTVGQEDIDGVSTTHYSASIDVDKALTEGAAALTSCGKTDEAAELEAARTQISGAIKQVDLQWWLDGDSQLIQARATVNVEPASLAALAQTLDPHSGSGHGDQAVAVLNGIQSVTLDATVKFSRFGEDFQIEKPAGEIQPLEGLLGGER
jgi:hypothetical protein